MKKTKRTVKPVFGVQTPFQSLAGQLLIAMPGMDDSRFDKAVIYVHAHSEKTGAQGLVINRPAREISFFEILSQLHIAHHGIDNPPQIMMGGPVDQARGFILHSDDYTGHMTTPAGGNVALTATTDIIADLVIGRGPRHSLIALGCATWMQGQLEEEIMSNVWLTAKPTPDLLFKEPFDMRWELALKSIGVNAGTLSPTAGKA